MKLLVDADAQQQRTRARLGVVATELGKLRLQLGRVHIVVVDGFRVRVDRVTLGHGGPHFRVALHHYVKHAHVLVGELILAQLAQADVRLERDIAAAGLEVAAEDLYEGRLAAAVRADQPVAVAIPELDRDVLEQGLGPELHRDIGGRKHSVAC